MSTKKKQTQFDKCKNTIFKQAKGEKFCCYYKKNIKISLRKAKHKKLDFYKKQIQTPTKTITFANQKEFY